MKLGSPGFNGERLREAREARGLTGVSLAELLPVTRQALSSYENGTHTPQPDVLQAISETLNIPVPFFYRPTRSGENNTMFFRALDQTPKRPRVSAERKYQWFKDIVAYLQQFVVFPQTNIPHLDQHDAPLQLGSAEIEALASQCRTHWGIGSGPISDVTLLLENNGVNVTRFVIHDERIDGFSEWSLTDEKPYIVLNADKGSAGRSRFDISHELGHLILHRYIRKSDHSVKAFYKTLESQAHRFAGSFLMPAESFARDFVIPDLDIFLSLKPKWKVSVKSMVYRCKNLNLLDENSERRLWIDYSRRGWTKGEPLDKEIEPERPRYVKRSLEMLVDEKIQTVEDIKDAVPFSPQDIEELSNLPSGYMMRPYPNIIELPRLKIFDIRKTSGS